MAASCSTLLTKAEFDAYKASNEKRIKALEDALANTLKKGQESNIVQSALKNSAIVALLAGTLGFESMKNQLNKLLETDNTRAKEFEKLVEKQEYERKLREDAEKERKRQQKELDDRVERKIKDAYDDNRKLENEFRRVSQETATNANEIKAVKNIATNADSTAKSALSKAGDALKGAGEAIKESKAAKLLAQLLDSKLFKLALAVATIFDIIGTLASLASVAALGKQIELLSKQNDEAWSIANKSFLEAGSAKWQARNANQQADIATTKASQAINEAQDAQNRATDAISKAGLAEAKATNAVNIANNANNTASQALSTANTTKAEVSDLKSQVRSLSAGLSSLSDRLSDLAANQSLQSLELKKALYELSRLEALVASLEGEIEGLGDPTPDTVRIDALNALISEARDTATKAFQLAEKGIQLAANKGAGEFAAQLQTQLATLKNNFESQTRTTTTQINQLGDRVTQVEQNAPEQTKLSQPQIEQVKQIADSEIKAITPQIVKENTVTPKEIEALQTSSNEKLINFLVPALTIALLPQILPKLNDIQNTTTQIKDNPKSPCLAPVYVPPVGSAVNRNIGLTTGLHTYTAAQTTAIKADTAATQIQVTQVNARTSAIQTTTNTVLTKVGEVAASISKLWRLIGVDRWINYVNMALLFHNAFMLTNNLGQTAISAIENVFNLFGLKLHDDKGEEIDLSTLVGKTVESVAKAALGNENYTAMTTTWKKANRIYQTGMNVLYGVQSIGNSLQSLTQLAIENTGRIGNALRKAGAVLENAYAPMIERVTAYTPFQQQLQNFTNTIEGSENMISNMDNVTSEVTSMNDAKKELFGDGTPGNKGQIKEFEDTVKGKSDEEKVKDDASKAASNSVEIAKTDLVKPDSL